MCGIILFIQYLQNGSFNIMSNTNLSGLFFMEKLTFSQLNGHTVSEKNVFYFSLMFYNMLNKYVLDVYINPHRIYDANISTGPNNNFFFGSGTCHVHLCTYSMFKDFLQYAMNLAYKQGNICFLQMQKQQESYKLILVTFDYLLCLINSIQLNNLSGIISNFSLV